jgi:hypothetical protein
MGCIEGRGKEDDHRHHSYVGSSRSWRHAGGCDRELHPQGVAPLMARQMSLYNMTTEAPSEGTQLGAPPPATRRLFAGSRKPWRFTKVQTGLSSHTFSRF